MQAAGGEEEVQARAGGGVVFGVEVDGLVVGLEGEAEDLGAEFGGKGEEGEGLVGGWGYAVVGRVVGWRGHGYVSSWLSGFEIHYMYGGLRLKGPGQRC